MDKGDAINPVVSGTGDTLATQLTHDEEESENMLHALDNESREAQNADSDLEQNTSNNRNPKEVSRMEEIEAGFKSQEAANWKKYQRKKELLLKEFELEEMKIKTQAEQKRQEKIHEIKRLQQELRWDEEIFRRAQESCALLKKEKLELLKLKFSDMQISMQETFNDVITKRQAYERPPIQESDQDSIQENGVAFTAIVKRDQWSAEEIVTLEIINTHSPPYMEQTGETRSSEEQAVNEDSDNSPENPDTRANPVAPLSVSANEPTSTLHEKRLMQEENDSQSDINEMSVTPVNNLKAFHLDCPKVNAKPLPGSTGKSIGMRNYISDERRAANVSSKSFHSESNSAESKTVLVVPPPQEDRLGSNQVKEKLEQPSVSPKFNEYEMSGSPCGLCVIINNAHFRLFSALEDLNYKNQKQNYPNSPSLLTGRPKCFDRDREGSDIDANNLAKVFKALDFDVCMYKDLYSDAILRTLREIGEGKVEQGIHSRLSMYQSFFLFILSHGENGSIYGVDGYKVLVSEIENIFTAGNCPSLANKPKALHFQSCRVMNGKAVFAPPSGTKVDFLVSFPTEPGHRSLRSTKHGTFYITELVKVLKEFHKYQDYSSMLAEVRHRLEIKYNMMHVSECNSRLRGKIFFHLKEGCSFEIEDEMVMLGAVGGTKQELVPSAR